MLTDQQLSEWKQLCEKATPGPWYVEVDGWVYRDCDQGPSSGAVPYWHRGPLKDEQSLCYPYTPCFDTLKFVAASREALPLLIAEVERLRGELAEAVRRSPHACEF